MSESDYTTLDLLRHGQLAISGVLCAGASAVVSDEGMQNLFNATDDGQWDVIISSPQDRCRLFAQKLADNKQYKLVIDPRFKELDFGEWIDVKSKVIWEKHQEKYQELWQNPDDFIAPNGEAMQDFYERVNTGLDDVLSKYKNQKILLITHGGVIRSILAKALEINTLSVLKFNIGYAQIVRLYHYSDGNFSLQSLGENAHV